MARCYSPAFSADVSTRQWRLVLAQEPDPLRSCWGTRAAHLTQAQPQVKLGEVGPGCPQGRSAAVFCKKNKTLRLLSRGCYRWSTWVQYQGWQFSEPPQVPRQICCGWHRHNGTLGPKPHPHTTWMVWFAGMEIRLNKAWGFALPVCSVLVFQCQDPVQHTVTNTLSDGSPLQSQDFLRPENKSSLNSLGGRPKWFKQQANARKGWFHCILEHTFDR